MKDLKHLKQVNYWVKTLLVIVVGGLIARWAGQQQATVMDFFEAFASINILVILGAELLDKVGDRLDYTSAFEGLTGKKSNYSWLGGLLLGLFAFLATLYIVAGTITMNLGAYSPGMILAAGTIALYIVLPETGDDEIILWLWLVSQIVTGGQYLPAALNPATLFSMFGR